MAARTTFEEKLSKMNKLQVWVVNRGRSDDDAFGNVDDLVGLGLSYQHMVTISRGRGSDSTYGNIDAFITEASNYTNGKMVLVSRGLGNDTSYRDVSMLPPSTCFRKFREAAHVNATPDTDVMYHYHNNK